LEGRLAPARSGHLDGCERCSAHARELRRIAELAAGDVPPEPSPLFWDHFAARVASALRDEPAPPAAEPRWLEWLRHPVSVWSGAAAVVVLMMATVVWRATLHAPTVRSAALEQARLEASDESAAAAAAADDPDVDEAWAVVRTAADGLGWEE